jgi:hypothetical protein
VSDLTPDEQRNVRAAVRFLRIRCGGWVPLTKALRLTRSTLQKVGATPVVAFRVARFVGVGIDDLLAGKYPPDGVCPHCGQLRDGT